MSEWIDDERRLPGLGRELLRLWRRAAHRPVWVALPPLLLALAVVAAHRRPEVAARVVLRVVEGPVEAGAPLAPTRHLAEHVESVALSDGRLLALIRAEQLYPAELRRGDRVAIEAMRDDLEVEVWRNEFLEAPEPGTPARSARVALSWRATDGAKALRVTRALAHLVETEQRASRLEAAGEATSDAEEALLDARALLERRRASAIEHALRLSSAPGDTLAAARLAGAARQAEAFEAEVRAATTGLEEARTRRRAEEDRVGVRFQLLDEEPPPLPAPRALVLPLLGLGVLVASAAVWAVVVGALDPRVRDERDLRRLGLPSLGRLDWRAPHAA